MSLYCNTSKVTSVEGQQADFLSIYLTNLHSINQLINKVFVLVMESFVQSFHSAQALNTLAFCLRGFKSLKMYPLLHRNAETFCTESAPPEFLNEHKIF